MIFLGLIEPLRTPIPAEKRLPPGEQQPALGCLLLLECARTRVGHPLPGHPHLPRALPAGNAWELRAPHGHRAPGFPAVPNRGNRRVLAGNERHGEAESCAVPRRGEAGAGRGGRAERDRSCVVPVPQPLLPRRLGESPRSVPRRPATVIIYEVLESTWRELYFYLHIKRYRGQGCRPAEGKGTLASAREAQRQP